MTEQEQKAFTAMREALESSAVCIQLMSDGPSRASWGDTLDIIDSALTAANAVSEPKVKLIPTAQEMGAPMQPQARELDIEARILAVCMADKELATYYTYQRTAPAGATESGVELAVDRKLLKVVSAVLAHPQATEPQAQGDANNPYNVDKPNEQADYGHDNSVSLGFQTPYYCAKCNEHIGDTDLPKNVPLRRYAVCYGCQEKADHPQANEPK